MKKDKNVDWFAGLMFNILDSNETWMEDYSKGTGKPAVKTKKANNKNDNISTTSHTQTKY